MPKKILLIDPPFQKFMNFSKGGIPIGLLSIAGSLKSRGHEVRVLDADYNPHGIPYPFVEKIENYRKYLIGLDNDNHSIWQGISKVIEEFSPDLVGISMISTKVKSGLRVAEISKRHDVPRVVAGGPHATILPDEILSYENIDGVCIGEAELNFEELFHRPIVSSPRIKDLDTLPQISRDSLVGLEGYRPEDLGYIMASRGCVGACKFCCSNALWGRMIRRRSLESIFEEIEEVNLKYKTRDFYLVDDTFTLSRERVMKFGDGMKSRGLFWSCLTRMDKIDRELLEYMLKSNCKMVKVGVESGNARVLKSMNKGEDLETIERSAQVLNEVGMPWLAYFIIGSPEETEEEMNDTREFIKKIKPTYLSPSVYTPYPGTGFEGNQFVDFASAEANHHSLEVTSGKIPKEKLREFMKFADDYNKRGSA